MTLTPNDIVWHNPDHDFETIIDRCGEFSNVPLLGTRGGISYSPILARRQFGYPMTMKPVYLFLDSEFFSYDGDVGNKKAQFVQAWCSIIRLDQNQLGNKSSVVHESYLKWVIGRATQIGMPYPMLRPLTSNTSAVPPPLPSQTIEEYQCRLHEANLESAAWRVKYQTSESEKDTIMGILEQTSWQLQEKE